MSHARSLGHTSFALFNLASVGGDIAAAGAAPVVDAGSIVAGVDGVRAPQTT